MKPSGGSPRSKVDPRAVWQRLAFLGRELQAGELAAVDVGIEAARLYYRLSCRYPGETDALRSQFARLLGVPQLLNWLEATLATCPERDAAQYLIAANAATACVAGGDPSNAMRLWQYALTLSRPLSKDLEAIDQDEAGDYDQSPAHLNACREFMQRIAPELRRRDDFLDLCCGTGLTTAQLPWPGKRVSGLDLELSGLHAQGRAKLFQTLYAGDLLQLLPEIPAGSHEAVWCCCALYFFADPAPIFAEVARLLKPGGIFAVNVWPSPEHWPVSQTKAGTFRYCHSRQLLADCAHANGLSLRHTEWMITYNLPNWLLIFHRR